MDTPTLLIDDIRDLFSDLAVPDGLADQPVELEKSLTALTAGCQKCRAFVPRTGPHLGHRQAARQRNLSRAR